MSVRTVRLSTPLAAPASAVWDAVRLPATLVHVARPLVTFPDLDGRKQPWQEGESLTTRVRLFDIVPFARHSLRFDRVDDGRFELQTDERGGPVRTWRHLIRVTPVGESSCEYLDEIVLDAGALTPAVAGWAGSFFRHRQRRLRDLVGRQLP